MYYVSVTRFPVLFKNVHFIRGPKQKKVENPPIFRRFLARFLFFSLLISPKNSSKKNYDRNEIRYKNHFFFSPVDQNPSFFRRNPRHENAFRGRVRRTRIYDFARATTRKISSTERNRTFIVLSGHQNDIAPKAGFRRNRTSLKKPIKPIRPCRGHVRFEAQTVSSPVQSYSRRRSFARARARSMRARLPNHKTPPR